MKEQFVSFIQAKELKELGMDKPCLAYYGQFKEEDVYELAYFVPEKSPDLKTNSNQEKIKIKLGQLLITAPLKQQVFSWAYSKHDLLCSIIPESTSRHKLLERTFNIVIYRFSMNLNVQTEIYRVDGKIVKYMNYEQAESECIDKLISILKEKQ
jgi:hypothetical protein